jgi:hypothetical protein
MSAWTQKATSKGSGGDFEKAPVGNHPAVLVAIIDMGRQEQEFQGKVTTPHRAYFVWELVTEKVSGTKGTNHVIAIDLTVSLNEKAKLRQWIEARIGRKMSEEAEYDISIELGQSCLLDVIANKKGYPVVNGMKAIPKGLTVTSPQRKPIAITLDEYKANPAVIPDWVPYCYGKPLSDIIDACEEFKKDKPATTDADWDGALNNKPATANEPIPY